MSTFTGQVTTLAGLLLTKYVDTGDRMVDGAIIAFLNFFLGVTLFQLIAVITYKKYRRLFFWRRRQPWEVDPEMVDDIPERVKKMSYSFEVKRTENFVKILKYVMTIKDKSRKVNSSDCYEAGMSKFDYCPIWHGQDYVYAKRDDHNLILTGHQPDVMNLLKHVGINSGQAKDDKTRKIYEWQGSPRELGHVLPKSLDGIFFEQKDELMTYVEKFKTGTMYPPQMKMCNSLGILLSGSPGTGKTGTISAIANYLDRDIVVIPMSQLQHRNHLDNIFKAEMYKDKVIVFEEFDTMMGVIKKRGGEVVEEVDPVEKYIEMLTRVTSEEERKEILQLISKAKSNDRIDLGYFLTKLDGLERKDGRIIIATTNHPELIDPALLRPGRFDCKLLLDKCTHQMIAQILGHYYSVDVSRAEVETIPDRSVTPLELINTCVRFSDWRLVVEQLSK